LDWSDGINPTLKDSWVPIYDFDPLQDSRWEEFLQRHPRASAFHTTGWLEALHTTYGYRPIAFTTATPGEELKNGIVFCRVEDWVRGCRMVSLPFSDHCQPLVNDSEEWATLVSALKERQGSGKWNYIELRPRFSFASEEGSSSVFAKGDKFIFHALDLRPTLDTIFRNFHRSCVQRKIHRAERENLDYEAGRSESLLAKFYHLLLLTRRRHRLPPQPLAWFQNLTACLGDRLVIHLVSKEGQPVASVLTILFKNSLVYKYGCSDERFHYLGGMPFLFWRTIQEGKALGAQELDLGRSEEDNRGLVNFKEHLGARAFQLVYLRIERQVSRPDWKMRYVRKALSHMPDPLLKIAGTYFYRYIG
jgi:hypothetical protein